ncbi:MAG TPA: cupin domain-containing protein [Burkholderiales bacterium]|nr:cupin domain-containing protein [Burkholderiales bacterium]
MLAIIQWKNLINNCKFDEKVGIRIAKIAGNEEFSTFITVISPNKWVKPHYHNHGDEHYHIISGNGKIILKNIEDHQEKSYLVNGNESFVVPEKTIHQLINIGTDDLILMFSCSMSHLSNDRFFASEPI